MRRFETSIKELMKAKNSYILEHGNEPIFLSNWDSDAKSISIPDFDYNLVKEDAQKYYYFTDEINNKRYFNTFYQHNFNSSLDDDNFTIASNGTSCLMLSLIALKEMELNNVLITTPIYFSTLNLLDEFNYNVDRFNLSSKNNYKIDLQKLEDDIKKKNIQILIITNPLFGIGIELDEDVISKISKICNKYDVWFIMDYVYGGFPWKTNNPIDYVFNNNIYNALRVSNKHVFIESISKRIFLNGVKTALIFTTRELLKRILRVSIFTVGSMSATQSKIIKEIYSIDNTETIIQQISNNVEIAKRNYDKIWTMLNNSNIKISDSSCGYFSLISIPKANNCNDMKFAIKILNDTGVLTTPHSRYLLDDSNYSFRINLLLDEYELINGITKIKTLK